METLRKRETSLFRTVPHRDNTNASGNGQSVTSPSPLIEAPGLRDSARIHRGTLPMPKDDPQYLARFARDYRDPLFPVKNVPYLRSKRFFDIIISLAILLLSAPVMLVVALIIKLTSRGPIIFKQVRVGTGGRYFWCYKFRSMCADAEAQKARLMHLNEATGPVFKIKHDPRITPIGHFIRRTSIDELPQFLNVLKGDMSIVGPRPPLPSEVCNYGEHERKRLAVRPGLTCLWQVSGRSNISFEHWVELDLLYIETMSFTQDVKIVLRTIPAVLTCSGAH